MSPYRPLVLLLLCACPLLVLTAHTTPPATNPAAPGFQPLPYNFAAQNQPLTTIISGAVPTWISGTLYRNGPGMFPAVARPHWFDGLAFLHAYHFKDGQITFDASFVGSTDYNNSAPTKKTEEFAPSYLNPNTPYAPNTGVTIQEVNGALLTSTAVSVCNQFDPITTGNVANPYTWGDTALPFMPSPEHRKRDAEGTYYHFVYDPISPTQYIMYSIPAGSNVRQVLAEIPTVTGLNYQHAYSLTKNYLVMSDIPVPLPTSFNWNDFVMTPNVPTLWRVFGKATGEEVVRLQSDGFMQFHPIHAYETETDSIIVDLITYPNATILQEFYLDVLLNNSAQASLHMARPMRFELPLSAATNTTITGTIIADVSIELPQVSPLVGDGPYTFSYSVGVLNDDSYWMDCLIKLNGNTGEVNTWTSPNTFPGEPMFVPSPSSTSEDDGVLLSIVLDLNLKSSFVLILNATDLSEVARVSIGRYIPFGFHGLYTDEFGVDGFVAEE